MGGEPAPAPAADIMIFISGNSGSKEITNSQHRILMILKSLGIAIKQVDISAPGMDEQRDFMRPVPRRRKDRDTPCPHKYSMGKSIVGIMMTLMLLMKMMNWRSSWAFQEKHPRLFLAKRRKLLKTVMRNHQLTQLQLREHLLKEHQLKEHLLKEHLLKEPLLKKLQLQQVLHQLELLLLKKLQLNSHSF